VQITIIKKPDTHDLLLVVSDGIEDVIANLTGIQEIALDPKGIDGKC
jgi:hypothetical protein